MDKREVASYQKMDIPQGWHILVDRNVVYGKTIYFRSNGMVTVSESGYKNIDPYRVDVCDSNFKTIIRGL